VGVAKSGFTKDQLIERARASIVEHGKLDESAFARLVERMRYVDGDYNDATTFTRLRSELGGARRPAYYLAIPPSMFPTVVEKLSGATDSANARVILEKPFGRDLASARGLNEILRRVFSESSIFRIDHYLGKEAVQNLMALRFGNALFEPLWRRGLIKHVQITVAEELGVERRGQFYDKTGALRDMVQNHLLQLLCIMAMEPPASSDPDAVRDEKLKVLRALRPLCDRDVLTKTVRGQYKAGAVRGAPVPGYLEEADIAADSSTETFAALKVEIDTWRWAGVPFYLRTGKRLQDRLTELVVTFDEVPHPIFENPPTSRTANELVIRLQPDESITMTILAKNPGEGMRLKPVSLALDLGETFKTRSLDAYERLLMDTVKGNLTLFMRRDELDAAWAWIDPIRAGWEQYDERPKIYIAGSWGPAASSAMIGRDGFAWHDEL
jgi:glucose-6-phosphate 1-dehydrogenase